MLLRREVIGPGAIGCGEGLELAVGEVGPGICLVGAIEAVDVGGHIIGLLIAQYGLLPGGLAPGHIAFDELSSGDHAVHPGTVVVAVGTPEWRVLVAFAGVGFPLPLPIGSMADHAVLCKDRLARYCIGGSVGDAEGDKAAKFFLTHVGQFLTEPIHIGNDRLHLAGIDGELFAIHAALHAAIDTVPDTALFVFPGTELREAIDHPNPGGSTCPAAAVDVATLAIEVVPCILCMAGFFAMGPMSREVSVMSV